MFIVLEGLDGSGKTTQLNNIIKYFKEKYPDKKIIVTREPGGYLNTVGEKIRDILLYNEMDDYTRALLYAASRYENSKIIKEHIEKDYIVICDRYIYSSLAYQASCISEMDEILLLNRMYDIIKPDYVLYFEITTDTYIQRKLARSETRELDVLEKKSDEFFEKVSKMYNIAFAETKANVIYIDANKTLEEVTSKTLKIIDDILKEEY